MSWLTGSGRWLWWDTLAVESPQWFSCSWGPCTVSELGAHVKKNCSTSSWVLHGMCWFTYSAYIAWGTSFQVTVFLCLPLWYIVMNSSWIVSLFWGMLTLPFRGFMILRKVSSSWGEGTWNTWMWAGGGSKLAWSVSSQCYLTWP